jgi:transposase InsO family protein
MTQAQYIISRKVNILELGRTLGNVSEACRKLGVSRQHYYDIRAAIQEEGLEGLLEKSRRAPRVGNRVPEEVERAVLDYSLEFPTHGQVRVSNELKRRGIQVGTCGVRGVWQRHNLLTKKFRLKRLEEWAAENVGILTESQVAALEEAKAEREVYGEVESPHPGFLLGQDTCYVGYIKGVGRLYQQTGLDTHSNVGFARVYLEKTALTAADFLNSKVLPFYDELGITVLRVLTDRGSEYCGRVETHPYELFLHLNGIEHTKTRPYTPRTNGGVERLNQTIEEEFYRVAFRKKLYRTLEEIQTDLDTYMEYYNRVRTNQGRYCQGRTPLETFRDGLALYQKYVFESPAEETEVMVS